MSQEDPRLTLQEFLELARVSGAGERDARYMTTRPGWIPGSDLPWHQVFDSASPSQFHSATYGGCVYSMAGAAVLRAVADGQGAPGATSPALGLHVSSLPTPLLILHSQGTRTVLTPRESPYKAASPAGASETGPSSSMW